MKTTKIFFALVIFSTLSASTLIGQNYKAPGIDFSGKIKDPRGITLGSISKEGIFKNHEGQKIALINNKGELVDTAGKILGKPEKNGNFHNIDGELEFTVRPSKDDQCEVLDKDGKIVTMVHNNYKARAGAIAHCLKMNMLK